MAKRYTRVTSADLDPNRRPLLEAILGNNANPWEPGEIDPETIRQARQLSQGIMPLDLAEERREHNNRPCVVIMPRELWKHFMPEGTEDIKATQ